MHFYSTCPCPYVRGKISWTHPELELKFKFGLFREFKQSAWFRSSACFGPFPVLLSTWAIPIPVTVLHPNPSFPCRQAETASPLTRRARLAYRTDRCFAEFFRQGDREKVRACVIARACRHSEGVRASMNDSEPFGVSLRHGFHF
jgi:hypothetical protein